MAIERWTNALEDKAHQFDAWSEGLNASHHTWSLGASRRRRADGFKANVSSRVGSGFSIIQCGCDPCHGTRGRREIGCSDDAYFGLLGLRSGREHVVQEDLPVTLTAGDMMVWDASLPCHFKTEGPINKTTLFISRKLLRDITGSDALTIGRLDVSGGWGALLRDRILSLPPVLSDMDPAAFSRLGRTLIEEVGLLAQDNRDVATPRAALMARVDSAIGKHLHDPDLGPADIAASVGISVRYLHHLFVDEPDTFRVRLIAKRLDAISRVLRQSPERSSSLTQVAFAHGFSSSAHFSRAFKRRFGVSPRDYRHAN